MAIGLVPEGQRLTGLGAAVLGLVVGLVAVVPVGVVDARGGAPTAKRAGGSAPAKLAVVDAFRGEATWYGPGMAGGVTASGDPFDDGALAAAHPTLPFGTLVRVSRVDGGGSVRVVVNDRLPEDAATRIDLTRAAGEVLDMIDEGRIPVVLEILQPTD